MVPELRDGDEVLVRPTKIAAVGDVVLVDHPTRSDVRILKRVAEVRPEGLWLLGDHPPESTDSRHFGVVPLSKLRGVVIARFDREA